MIQGLYAAASGMSSLEERQAVMANNIANAMTPGYKRMRCADRGFHTLLLSAKRHPFWSNRVPGPGGGLQLNEAFTDYATGRLNTTGNPFDLALEGPGFFVVDTPKGERFTRNGCFTVDSDGHLATQGGMKVQAEGGGPIDVTGSSVAIGEDGTVTVDGENRGRIRTVAFADSRLMNREGGDLFIASDPALRGMTPGTARIRAGALELSNVDLPTEMIEMVLGMRAYEANRKCINCADETIGRLIDQVGMPL